MSVSAGLLSPAQIRPAASRKKTAAWLIGAALLASVALAIVVSPYVGGPLFIVCAIAIYFVATERDAAALITACVTLIVALPPITLVQPLGPLGLPAVEVGLVALGWWVQQKLHPDSAIARGFQPVRIGIGVFVGAMVIGAAAGWARPLTALESSGVNRALITLAAFAGISLLAADGISSLERLQQLLQRVVLAGLFLALFGFLQSTVHFDPFAHFHPIGGTVAISKLADTVFHVRGSVVRVFGTTASPIEYDVVLCAILPLALHFALFAPPLKRMQRWLMVTLIAAAIPLGVSRSGVVGLAVGMLVLAGCWCRRWRVRALFTTIMGLAVIRVVKPDIFGTIYDLVRYAGNDPSVTARVDRYPRLFAYFSQHPLFGRGYGTFIPHLYMFVDDTYLLTLVETGLLGLLALFVVIFVGSSCAHAVRRRSTGFEIAHLGQAILASIVTLAVSFSAFDGLSFRTAAFLFFIMVGCAGALWRLAPGVRGKVMAGRISWRMDNTGTRRRFKIGPTSR